MRPADHPPHDEFELRQRRNLMSRWASMDQAARDAYQARARPRSGSSPPPASWEGHGDDDDGTRVRRRVVHRLAAHPAGARARAAWAKLRILLYRLDGEDGPAVDDGEATACAPNPASGPGASVRPGRDFLMWRHVEGADLGAAAMTPAGAVAFRPRGGGRGPFVLADREALDTGLLLLCEFLNNGELGARARVRPHELYELWNFVSPYVLNKSVKEMVSSWDHLGSSRP